MQSIPAYAEHIARRPRRAILYCALWLAVLPPLARVVVELQLRQLPERPGTLWMMSDAERAARFGAAARKSPLAEAVKEPESESPAESEFPAGPGYVLATGRGLWPAASIPQPALSEAELFPNETKAVPHAAEGFWERSGRPGALDDLVRALLYQEDQAFYTHPGYSVREIGMALRDTLWHGKRLRGASTITQQIARTLFLSNQKTLVRKLVEFRVARALHLRLSKRATLTAYLNHVYWGRGAQGITAAARMHFNTAPQQLSRPEIARLIALLPNPNACGARGVRRCRDPGVLRRAQRIEAMFAKTTQR